MTANVSKTFLKAQGANLGISTLNQSSCACFPISPTSKQDMGQSNLLSCLLPLQTVAEINAHYAGYIQDKRQRWVRGTKARGLSIVSPSLVIKQREPQCSRLNTRGRQTSGRSGSNKNYKLIMPIRKLDT